MPGTIVNHPTTAGLVRHPSTLDINHPASSGATNHPASFNGNFAQFWAAQVGSANVLQVFQSDLGLTYGATPLAAGTTPPVGTLTGTIAGSFVPLLFTCTNAAAIGSGALFSLSVDGGGSTIMTGINPAVGVPVALTGAASGLSMAWAAGTAALDNTWKGTSAGLADQQTGNTIHNYTQATSAQQPIVTVGLNGHCGVATDGVDDSLVSTLDLPAPGTSAWFFAGVYRVLSIPGATAYLFTDAAGMGGLFVGAATKNTAQFNGSTANTNAGSNGGAWGRLEAAFGNTVADYTRFGATTVTGTSAGNNDPAASQRIGGRGGASNPVNAEFLTGAYLLGLPSAASLAAFSAAVTQYYGATVVV